MPIERRIIEDSERGPGAVAWLGEQAENRWDLAKQYHVNLINAWQGGVRGLIIDNLQDTADGVSEAGKELGRGTMQLINRGVVGTTRDLLTLHPFRATGQLVHTGVSVTNHLTQAGLHLTNIPFDWTVNTVKNSGRIIGGFAGVDLANDAYNPLELSSTGTTFDANTAHTSSFLITEKNSSTKSTKKSSKGDKREARRKKREEQAAAAKTKKEAADRKNNSSKSTTTSSSTSAPPPKKPRKATTPPSTTTPRVASPAPAATTTTAPAASTSAPSTGAPSASASS